MPIKRSTARRSLALAASVLWLGLGIAGCGPDESAVNTEGEAVEIGLLQYRVEMTRYLNVNDVGDAALLEGADPEPLDERYLAVFVQVKNEDDAGKTVPSGGMKLIDTRGNEFRPLAIDNDFTLELGSRIQGHSEIPEPGSPAFYGPEKGAMLLFLIGNDTSENQPLELQVPSLSGPAEFVELDI